LSIRRAIPDRRSCSNERASGGTGKELAAGEIHDQSPRHRRPFIAINCGAVPENLIGSGLFGHERGAFTSADRRREGCFELANGGTLFLDEITEMRLDMQVKLLRVVEERKVRRLGGTVEVPVDVRIVAASNRSLAQAICEGRLREDLFYRLNVFQVELPPPRHRLDDLPALAEHFIEEFNREHRKSVQGLEQDFLDALRVHTWPGNIRELRNVIQRGVIVCRSPMLSLRDLPLELASRRGPEVSFIVRLGSSGSEVERELLFRTVEYVGGNKARAADILGMSRGTLHNRLKRYSPPETNGHVNRRANRNGRNGLT
jgi:two-component system, NtrC family, response regulator HydG